MSQISPPIKVWFRMTAYGVILGTIASILVGLVISVDSFNESSISSIINHVAGITMLYGFFGMLFGFNAGLISGLVMGIVSAVLFYEMRRPRTYKISMGLITFIITSYVLFGGSGSLSTNIDFTWAGALGMSVVIAVYASQITARKYIKEISIRKGKAKA